MNKLRLILLTLIAYALGLLVWTLYQRYFPPPAQIVFLGDSIVDFWDLPSSFRTTTYYNSGIGAQTSDQLLHRFSEDVSRRTPRAVLILVGTNDIVYQEGLINFQHNIEAMVQLAQAEHITPILCSILPVSQSVAFYRDPQLILAFNGWLSTYAADHGLAFIDYYHSMIDSNGFLIQDYSDDGLHPNLAGYAVMTNLTKPILAQFSTATPSR